MSLFGPIFHASPVDLGIIFQYKIYISCIMSCGNKLVSKYAPTNGSFPFFLEMNKTVRTHSRFTIILSQIQRETKAFLLIVRHNTEGPPISDWQ